MLETLYQLGVATSFSRPRVSNENAYCESIFTTCKYGPHQRHAGLTREVLAKRKDVYQQAKLRNPERWSGQTYNWELVEKVYLNPTRDRIEI